jgi:hypothetical protein
VETRICYHQDSNKCAADLNLGAKWENNYCTYQVSAPGYLRCRSYSDAQITSCRVLSNDECKNNPFQGILKCDLLQSPCQDKETCEANGKIIHVIDLLIWFRLLF